MGSGQVAAVVDAALVSVLVPEAADAAVVALPVVLDAAGSATSVAPHTDAAIAAHTVAALSLSADAPRSLDAAVAHLDAAILHDAAVAAVNLDAAAAPADAAIAHPDAAPGEDERVKTEMAKARNAMLHEDFAGALSAAEAALRANPNNYAAHLLATRAACRAGRPAVARSHASTLNPRDRRTAMRACLAPVTTPTRTPRRSERPQLWRGCDRRGVGASLDET